MKKLIFFGIIFIPGYIISCQEEIISNTSVEVDENTIIYYYDNSGKNLLDSSTYNHFWTDSIHVFEVTNGVKTEVNNSKMEIPHNFRVLQDSLKNYYLDIFFDTDTTFLQLNKNIIDTVIVKFYKASGLIRLDKIWYNGVLVWQWNTFREFSIVKSL